ncbi:MULTISPECIES: TetR/AcrR family transcriptional regulator [unclassified Rhodococcus (in: high G+C Gram-positive bacteria)]|uniref:TetR/AcrR family transcriptional regulator n=1 Tax=unclassified Rhodococcus (in: high G+C Gram-positive bacteria) TaxID=192944 RepID=UPI001639C537|nr:MULTISPECIES: TetR/AcrR family transcriptional regulator [unclassified Rhodococcus (in: high G+C Gram-positive bacteria)]MBC2638036.1 TetR family transcriptional regulator [Rhodococcus sp. 3A]MBC2897217.1 TetR family transcriptional regulator [Rhodococcus sp. 4CII]
MPRLIDHNQRQQEIAEALWRVIQRDGIGAVSVRDVAAEAGISSGSLRHVFASKAELLAYSMRLVAMRVRERAQAHATIADPWQRAMAVLDEVLPLDDRRRCEMEVNLALVAESPAHPMLKEIALDAQRQLRGACAAILTDLAQRGLIAPGLDVDAEAMRLHALVDGAAMHVLLGATDTPHTAQRMIAEHLRDLA